MMVVFPNDVSQPLRLTVFGINNGTDLAETLSEAGPMRGFGRGHCR